MSGSSPKVSVTVQYMNHCKRAALYELVDGNTRRSCSLFIRISWVHRACCIRGYAIDNETDRIICARTRQPLFPINHTSHAHY